MEENKSIVDLFVEKYGNRGSIRRAQLEEEELKDLLRGLKLVKLSDGRFDVLGDVDFSNLGLNSLLEIPIRIRRVAGSFHCDSNQLTNLEGAPERVDGSFDCYDNQLTTLKGVPKYVGGTFRCDNNQLTSLKGAPKFVGGDFICGGNQLTTLEGAPERVGGSFYCDDNQLTSLKGAPKYVGGNFECNFNSKEFTEEEVRKLIDVRGEVVVSEEGY